MIVVSDSKFLFVYLCNVYLYQKISSQSMTEISTYNLNQQVWHVPPKHTRLYNFFSKIPLSLYASPQLLTITIVSLLSFFDSLIATEKA